MMFRVFGPLRRAILSKMADGGVRRAHGRVTWRNSPAGRRTLRVLLPVVVLLGITAPLVDVSVAAATLDTWTVPTQSPNPIPQGFTASYTPITITDSNGASGSDWVKLAASGFVTGATFSDSGESNSGCVVESSGSYTFNDVTVSTTTSVATGTHVFTITATRYSNSSCTNSTGSTAAANGSLVVVAAASDGNGTMTVSPTSAIQSSAGNDLGFTFTAPSGGSFGTGSEVTLVIPSGWTAPSTTSGTPGYTTATAGTCAPGTLAVSGSGPWTITVPMTCAASTSFTINYGASTGPVAPSSTGTASFTTSTQQGPSGLLAITTQPTVTIVAAAADGDGTMTVSPSTAVASNAGNILTFTYTAPSGGSFGAGSEVTLVIPSGWTAPSTTFGTPGYTTVTAGTCTPGTRTISSQTITVPMTCAASTSFTITYGASTGPTAQSSAGTATFTTSSQQGTTGLAAIATQPTVSVYNAATSGNGTMSVSPTTAVAGSVGNVLTFTFTAPSAASFISGSAVTVTLPSGWTAPSTTSSNAGYSTATAGTCNPGTLSVFSQTITVLMACPASTSFTITYGANAGPTAQSGTGTATFTTQTREGAGTLTSITAQPTLTVVAAAADGSGTMTVAPLAVAAGSAGNAFTFTYTAPGGGSFGAGSEVTVAVPSGWTAPQTTTSNGAGYTTASAGTCTPGTLSVSGQTITVPMTCAAGTQFTITYADATATTAVSTATFTTQSQQGTFGLSAITTSPAVSITPASENKLVITTQPASSITAGGTVSVGVTVEDQYGNPITTGNAGSTDSVAVTLTSGSFAGGTTTVTATNGVASFSGLQITTAGSVKITASDATAGGVASAQTNTITVNPAAENKLAITTQPASSITAGGTVSVGVTIEDQYGNTITTGTTGSTDSIKVTLSSGSFAGGTTTVAASNGVASFSGLQLTLVGSYTITASDTTHGTVSSAQTSSFGVTPAAVSSIAITTSPGSFTAGGSTGIVVTAYDAYGNIATNSSSSVTLTESSGPSATFTGTGPVTLSGGAASFSISTTTAGTFTVTGHDGVINSAASGAFTVSPGPAAFLSFVQQPTNAFAGLAMPSPVTVQLLDAYGNSVSSSGVSITLSPSVNSIYSGATQLTGSTGLATFSPVINTAAANVTFTASSSGLIDPAASSAFTVSVIVSSSAGALTDTPTDAGSGVASVAYHYCSGSSGTCTSGTPWVSIGTSSTSSGNYPVTWSAQPASGYYRVVASATDNAGNTSGSSAITPVAVDNTAPTGGSLTANNSSSSTYNTTGTMPLSVTNFTVALSGIATNSITRAQGTLSNNTCGSLSGSTAVTVSGGSDSTTLSTGCYQYTLTGTDNAGNTATVTSAIVKVDTSGPSASTPIVGSPHSYVSGGTTYLDNGVVLTDTASDPNSGIASVAYYYCTGSSGACTSGTPWTAIGSSSTSAANYAVTWGGQPADGAYRIVAVSTSQAGATGASGIEAVTTDNTAPTGGAVTVNLTAASTSGSSSFAFSSFSINSRTDYSSLGGSGLASSVLTVQSESYSFGSCGAPGSGGPFATPTTVSGTTQPGGITSGSCYLYTLTGTDNLGNAVSISTTVKYA